MRGIAALLVVGGSLAAPRVEARCPAQANVGLVVDGSTAYVSAHGTLRGIDLPSGQVRWRLDDGARAVAAAGAGRLIAERAGARLVLDGATGREMDEEAPPPEVTPADLSETTLGRRIYRIGGDCARGELEILDAVRRAVVRPPVALPSGAVAVAGGATILVVLRPDGGLIIFPARGQPHPRVAGWRQVRP